jgi:hypothetical protein
MKLAAMPPAWARWFIYSLLIACCLLIVPSGASAAPADASIHALAAPSPLFADLLQEVIGNRTRLIQVSFLFILIGVFILWKK